MNKLRGIHPLLLFYFAVLPNLQAVKILVENDRWGNVQSQEIQLVLESTASVFSPYAPILIEKKISVSPSSHPRIYYERTLNGEHQINLSAKDRYWCQYAFQFSHELGHLICKTTRGDQTNQWFEESLCEAASLFALLELSKIWDQNPPNPAWENYAKEFKNYRTDRIKTSGYPENFQLPSWWNKNRFKLSQNANLRKQNLWVAIELLPLIEKDPSSAWSSCEWLNHSQSEHTKSFEIYLKNWKLACPKREQKQFVQKVTHLFGIF